MAKVAKKAAKTLEPLAFDRDIVVKLMKDAFGIKTSAKETNDWLTAKLAGLSEQLDDDDMDELEANFPDSHEVASAVMEAIEKGQPVVVIDGDEEEVDEDEEDTEAESEVDEDADDETEDEDESEVDDEDEEETEDDDSDEDSESDESSDDSDEDDDSEEDEEMEEVKTKKAAPAKKPAAKPAPAKPAAKAPAKKADAKKPAAKAAPAAKGKVPVKKLPAGPVTSRSKGKTYYIIKLLSQASKKKPITKERILAELVKKFGKEAEAGMAVTINSQINGQLKANKQMVIGKDGNGGYWLEDMGNYTFPA